MSKKWSALQQTAKEIRSIISDGKRHSVSVQTADGYTLCRWVDKCDEITCVYPMSDEIITLYGRMAKREIKPYHKMVNIAFRDICRKKRKAEQERRLRVKGE